MFSVRPVFRSTRGRTPWLVPPVSGMHTSASGVGGSFGVPDPIPWAGMEKHFCIKVNWIRAPAETILAFDMPGPRNNLGSFDAIADRPIRQLGGFAPSTDMTNRGAHGARWNYLFCDGHVSTLKAVETVRPAATFLDTINSLNYMWTRNPRD